MPKNKRMEFTGKGMSGQPFDDEDERREMRERHNHYDGNFLSAEEFLDEAGLTWLSKIGSAFPAILKAFIVWGIVGGAVLTAMKLGLL